MSGQPQADPLRLERCPQCGYQLEGLPEEGTCPECGRRYDPSVVVLHGWGRGNHASIHTAPLGFAVALWAFQSIWMVNMLVNPSFRRSWFSGPMVLAWAVLTGFFVWRRRNSPLPGLIQVILGSAGCAQLDSPAHNRDVTPTAWRHVTDVGLSELGDGRYRLRALTGRAWWWPAGTPVDAEVHLTPGQAEALRSRINAWRAGGDDLGAITGGVATLQ